MPRYFLHVRDGNDWVEDEEGSELPDLDVALAEAQHAVRGIVTEKVRAGEVLNRGAIEITDGDGSILALVAFTDALKLH